MKKKLLTALIAIVIAVVMAFCLAACNFGGNEPEGNEPGGTEQGDPEQGGSEQSDPEPEPEPEPEPVIGTEGLEYELSNDDIYYIVTGIGTATKETEIIIPSEHNGKPVKKIDDRAFEDCDSLESITISNSVTSIGYNAFHDCNSLESATIPNSVTTIGTWAFNNCTSLENVALGNGVTSIGGDAFYNCTSLKFNEYDNALYLGNAQNPYVALIGAKNDDIISCNINGNTKVIADLAFWCCYSLASVTIGSSVTSIGNYAFGVCDSLESMTVDSENAILHSEGNCIIETASKTLVAGCKNSVIPNDGSVTSIGDYAFHSCGFTGINIPDSITYIGDYAFQSCTSLANITIPNSVTYIGSGAFSQCFSLESIAIPNSVTSIGTYAFYYCDSLETVYYTGSKAQWSSIDIGENNTELTNANIVFDYKD